MDFSKKCSKLKFYSGLSKELRSELTKVYQINELDIEDVFTNTQLSKIEFHRYFYVALQLPEYDFEHRTVSIKEIHSFIHEDTLLIIDKHHYRYAESFHEKWQKEYQAFTSFEVFFGMNIYFGWLPESESYLQLIGIILLMVVSSMLAYLFFRRKHWL